MEISVEISKKTKNRTTVFCQTVLLLGIYPKEWKSEYFRDTQTLVFIQHHSQQPSYGIGQSEITGDHHVKQNKPNSERQIQHVFSHIECKR
jgi:hypothetical protein